MLFSATLAASLLTAVWAVLHFPRLVQHAASTSEYDWDYIVVGAGLAGIIVAERLVEHYHEVLLLEGSEPSTASTGGHGSTIWNAPSLTVYDIASQDAEIFTTGQT